VGGDTLTCGVCGKEFALTDIVKFIQHKVLNCNKENCKDAIKSSGGGDGGPSATANAVGDDTSASGSGDSDAENGSNNNNTKEADSIKENGPIVEEEEKEEKAQKDENKEAKSGEESDSVKNDEESAADSSANVKSEDSSSERTSLSRKRKAEFVDRDTNTVFSGENCFRERERDRREKEAIHDPAGEDVVTRGRPIHSGFAVKT